MQIKLLEIFDINRTRIFSKQLDFNLFYVPLRRKTTFTPQQRQPQNSQTHFNVKNNMYKVVVIPHKANDYNVLAYQNAFNALVYL